MNRFISCSNCSEVVIKSHGADAKLRNKVLIIKGKDVYAVCKGCGHEIRVPLKLDEEVFNSPDKLSLYVNEK
jgi:RNase P subunit RPR2